MLKIFRISDVSFEVFEQDKNGSTIKVFPNKFHSEAAAQAFINAQGGEPAGKVEGAAPEKESASTTRRKKVQKKEVEGGVEHA